ncbi:hypothetical protein ACFLXE_08510, partial [Chloroflexota bacterium]
TNSTKQLAELLMDVLFQRDGDVLQLVDGSTKAVSDKNGQGDYSPSANFSTWTRPVLMGKAPLGE